VSPHKVELSGTLERLLGAPVARLERRPYPYETSHPLEELDVVLGDGSALRLIRKDLAQPASSKPAFLHNPAREIETYQLILEPAGLGTAKFYGADGPAFFVEKVDGSELWQVGDLEAWQRVAAWLARMHAALAEQAHQPHLLRYDGDFYRLWLARAKEISGELGPVAEVYDAAIERLLTLPRTVVHGEFYPSNVLVADGRICPVDWEMAAAGPGLHDLAALVAGAWSERKRAAIVRAYGDVDEESLDCCRLHLAVRWLGWSAGWRPPAEHARDWRREALELAERLGV
jgi:Phosphotransferase enzyme family